MSARLSQVLSFSGLPCYDHLNETGRVGYIIKTSGAGSEITYDKHAGHRFMIAVERERLLAKTERVLRRVGIAYTRTNDTITVPLRAGARDNVPRTIKFPSHKEQP